MSRWVRLVEAPTGRLLHPRVRLASTFWGRFWGWMGHEVGPSDALLLLHTPAVHTMFMRVPIDVVMLDRAGRVLAVRQAARPWRLVRSAAGARHALELSPGAAQRLGIRPGLELAWAEPAGPASPS